LHSHESVLFFAGSSSSWAQATIALTAPKAHDVTLFVVSFFSGMTPTETDARLVEVESAVEHALNRAKIWSKYAKSIIAYVDKRNSLGKQAVFLLIVLAATDDRGFFWWVPCSLFM